MSVDVSLKGVAIPFFSVLLRGVQLGPATLSAMTFYLTRPTIINQTDIDLKPGIRKQNKSSLCLNCFLGYENQTNTIFRVLFRRKIEQSSMVRVKDKEAKPGIVRGSEK